MKWIESWAASWPIEQWEPWVQQFRKEAKELLAHCRDYSKPAPTERRA